MPRPKELLVDIVEGHGWFSLMFDGWTDKFHKRSYPGLSVAFIRPTTWTSHIKTLSVRVCDTHTGESLDNHIQNELDDFGVSDHRKVTLCSTHDGAASVLK